MKYILGTGALVAIITCFVLTDYQYEREGLGWTYALWSLLVLVLVVIAIKKKKK
jgi:hypothetical protein